MKIKSKVFKRKTGKSKGKWIARVEYFDEVDGRRRYVEHTFAKRTEAVDDRNREVSRIQATQGNIQTGDKRKFGELKVAQTALMEAFHQAAKGNNDFHLYRAYAQWKKIPMPDYPTSPPFRWHQKVGIILVRPVASQNDGCM